MLSDIYRYVLAKANIDARTLGNKKFCKGTAYCEDLQIYQNQA